MYIYNITTKVHTSIQEQWVEWMKMHHIPQIMATGCFTESQFVRILELDDSEGPTYATQFKAASKADYNRYIAIHAPALRKDSLSKWGEKIIGFRSLMELVH
jgi:Domain of unknown function (DUF4286)